MRSTLEADNSLFARTLPARLDSPITDLMGLFDFFRLPPKPKPAVQKRLAGLNPLLGQLIIKDLVFHIDSASLSEVKDKQSNRRWNLWIGTEPRELEFDGMPWRWAPNIRGDEVRIQAPELSSILGSKLYFPNAYDRQSDEYLFSMYVFSHEDVYESEMVFLERSESSVRILWKGLCNLGFNSELGYGNGVPFALHANLSIE